uniref:Uncharacterized protein n=1 Tax=Anguilla anguilla TaxID=7936 RepID=A0A0E9XQ17_ANGAN
MQVNLQRKQDGVSGNLYSSPFQVELIYKARKMNDGNKKYKTQLPTVTGTGQAQLHHL